MARLCERPGCSQPAEVIYGIDAEHLVVWIEPFDGAVGHRAGVLCRRHADAMVVPLGWMLDDRREATPRLFRTKEVVPPAAPRPRRHRAHHARDETGQLSLPGADLLPAEELDTAEPAVVDEAATVGDPAAIDAPATELPSEDAVDEAPAPWKPVFDHRDDLDGLLTASSPLLSRAFGKRDRPTDR